MFCIIIIVPLLLWSWKKNKSYKIDQQGRQVLNFQITMTLLLVAAVFVVMLVPATLAIAQQASDAAFGDSPSMLLLTLCVPTPLILVGIFCFYQGAVNAMRSLSD